MAAEAEHSEPEWLDREQLHEWQSLVALMVALPAALDAQLKRDANLNTFEYHVLVALGEAPDGVRVMTELAAQSRGSLSRLSHAVSRLEASGWVVRRSCGGAGRRTEARLTAAGREKLVATAPGHVREARRVVVDAMSDEQFAQLGAAARCILAVAAPEMAVGLGADRPPSS